MDMHPSQQDILEILKSFKPWKKEEEINLTKNDKHSTFYAGLMIFCSQEQVPNTASNMPSHYHLTH